MDIRSRQREDLRSARLSEANTRSVHSRSTEREASIKSSGSSVILRTASAETRNRGDPNGDGGGGGAREAVGVGGRRNNRRCAQQHVAGSGEGESGAAVGHG